MKGLLRFLSPMAPDQSGAAAVLYDMDCITVICDAGGCTGNICGFDEPRWQEKPGAVFSAGLRDMDAILGRDDRLVEKLADAAKRVDASFTAIIGTPVPAVIGTDYKALTRMMEKECGMPAIAVECTGTRLYEEGASETYLTLFRRFAARVENAETKKETEISGKKIAGILGMTPLDISLRDGRPYFTSSKRYQIYDEIYTYGMGSGFEAVKNAANVSETILVSPSGLKAAQFLEKKFGIPYRWDYPFIGESLSRKLTALAGRRVLIVHQQTAASAAREQIEEAGASDVNCATWFLQPEELKREGDLRLETEAQFAELCREGGYDAIVGDPEFLRAARMLGYQGNLVEFPHFAVSGVLADE